MSDFFEDLYASAGEDYARIPWAQLEPRPAMVAWLDAHPDHPGPALVVACGLGDDAEELARRGYAVEAFDVAPTAIAATRRRFPESSVAYRVADVFDLPFDWRGRFGLVIEIHTVQALAPERQGAAAAAIAGCVAPGGRLLVRAAVDPAHDQAGPPWPLAGLGVFEAAGLVEQCRHVDGIWHELDYARS